MKELKWNKLKSERLKLVRGVSFEEIIETEMICIRDHPSRQSQQILYYYYKGYIWLVPFVEEKHYIFLKTLYPSRKHTKKYYKGDL